MQQVSNASILIMYTMYFLAALFGYLTFNGKICWPFYDLEATETNICLYFDILLF